MSNKFDLAKERVLAAATEICSPEPDDEAAPDAIRTAANGQTALAPRVATRVLDQLRGGDPTALTPRELEVLALVADGNRNRDIAHQLHIGEATVKSHLLHIYAKLGVDDRAHAVTRAIERRLIRV